MKITSAFLVLASALQQSETTSTSASRDVAQTLTAEVRNVRSNMGSSRIIRIPHPTDEEANAAGTDPATVIGTMLESIEGDEWGMTEDGIDVMVSLF